MRKVARPPACGDRDVFRCLATEVAPVCGIPACLHACLPACAHDSVHARTCTHRNQRLRRQQAQRRTERSHVPSGRWSSWIPACRCAPSQLPPAPNDALNDVLGPRVSRAHGTRVSHASNGKLKSGYHARSSVRSLRVWGAWAWAAGELRVAHRDASRDIAVVWGLVLPRRDDDAVVCPAPGM